MSEQNFLKNVENHSMTIIRNDGVSRHLWFSREGSRIYYFQIITEPGFLMVSGDCGTFVFERIRDMFEFFRMDESDFSRVKDRQLQINPSYWGEKVVDGRDRCFEYDGEKTEEYFRKELKEDLEEDAFNRDQEDEIDGILNDLYFHEGEHVLAVSIQDSDKLSSDYVECIIKSPTFEYLWCLRAIVWGIAEFEKATGKESA